VLDVVVVVSILSGVNVAATRGSLEPSRLSPEIGGVPPFLPLKNGEEGHHGRCPQLILFLSTEVDLGTSPRRRLKAGDFKD
jgi:hypothetical protein